MAIQRMPTMNTHLTLVGPNARVDTWTLDPDDLAAVGDEVHLVPLPKGAVLYDWQTLSNGQDSAAGFVYDLVATDGVTSRRLLVNATNGQAANPGKARSSNDEEMVHVGWTVPTQGWAVALRVVAPPTTPKADNWFKLVLEYNK